MNLSWDNVRLVGASILVLVGIVCAGFDVWHHHAFGGLCYLVACASVAMVIAGLSDNYWSFLLVAPALATGLGVGQLMFDSAIMDLPRQTQIGEIQRALLTSRVEPLVAADDKDLRDAVKKACDWQTFNDLTAFQHDYYLSELPAIVTVADPVYLKAYHWFGSPPPPDCFAYVERIRERHPDFWTAMETSEAWKQTLVHP